MMESQTYRLAVWEDEALAPFADALQVAANRIGVSVLRLPRVSCERGLRAGLLDAALLPAIHVLVEADEFDVYPAVAVSAWRGPHASIHLPGGLERTPGTLSCTVDVAQEAVMSRIVLKEHYGMQPAVREVPSGEPVDASADAVLRVGEIRSDPHAELVHEEGGVTLDLGQEWFELTNYPMVWGLFVSRAGEADSRMVPLLREAASVVAGDEEEPVDVEEEVSDAGIRLRLDDMATASLTELADLLFFYRVTEEVPAVRFASDPEAEPRPRDDEEEPLL